MNLLQREKNARIVISVRCAVRHGADYAGKWASAISIVGWARVSRTGNIWSGRSKRRLCIPTISNRKLRRRMSDLLKSGALNRMSEELNHIPPRKLINPLFSLLYNGDPQIKWAAVEALGQAVSKLADQDIEAARVMMRRLMWNLNDESGGIGWGSPEAMGEILAGHEGLAKEYAHILMSYMKEEGNYLELESLQRGLLWGIGRACRKRPDLFREAAPLIIPYLRSQDATVRALAAWVLGVMGFEPALEHLEQLTTDDTEIEIYLESQLVKYRVKDIAENARKSIGSKSKKQVQGIRHRPPRSKEYRSKRHLH